MITHGLAYSWIKHVIGMNLGAKWILDDYEAKIVDYRCL